MGEESLSVRNVDKPDIRWRLIAKRTALIFAALFGSALAGDQVKYGVVWIHSLVPLFFALFLVLVAEGIHGSRERRKQARFKKKKAKEVLKITSSAAKAEKLIKAEENPQPGAGPDILMWRDPEQLFFQYNPLYFFSAFCILSGIGLLSQHLGTLPWMQGQMLLFMVIQAYELLLIAGTAILLRFAGLDRPVVMLCLLEAFFLFDCTLRTGPMSGLGWFAPWLTMGWVILTVGKGLFLGWLLRLKCPLRALVVPVSVLIGVAAGPYIFGMSSIRKEILQILAVWYGAGILAYALWLTPAVKNQVSPDAPDQGLVQRAFRVATTLWVVIFMIHLFAWGIIYDIAMNSAQVAPFYLFWFFSRQKEIWRWVGGFGAIAAASTIPAAVAPCALIIGIIFFLQAWFSRRHRLYVASLLSLYIACWTIGWQGLTLPEPKLWLNIATASALALTCWRLRLFSAIPAVILVLLPGAEKLIPHGTLQWGILVFSVGLMALITGVAINLGQKRPDE